MKLDGEDMLNRVLLAVLYALLGVLPIAMLCAVLEVRADRRADERYISEHKCAVIGFVGANGFFGSIEPMYQCQDGKKFIPRTLRAAARGASDSSAPQGERPD